MGVTARARWVLVVAPAGIGAGVTTSSLATGRPDLPAPALAAVDVTCLAAAVAAALWLTRKDHHG